MSILSNLVPKHNFFQLLMFPVCLRPPFKWLEQWRATSFGTGASFSWTRLERFTCTWFSHNTKFCLSACLKPQMVVHVGKDEILVLLDGCGTTPTNTGSLVYQNTVCSVKCQVCYKALFGPERNLEAQNSTLNPQPCVGFKF